MLTGELQFDLSADDQGLFLAEVDELLQRVEESLVEMYLAGVSVRRVEDITEALWGTRVSPSTVSNLNKKIYAKIDAWQNPAHRRRAPVSLS